MRAREHPLGPQSVARGASGRAQEIRAEATSAAALGYRGQAATYQGWSGQGKARVRLAAAKLSRPFPATGDLQATGIDDSRRLLCFLRQEWFAGRLLWFIPHSYPNPKQASHSGRWGGSSRVSRGRCRYRAGTAGSNGGCPQATYCICVHQEPLSMIFSCI